MMGAPGLFGRDPPELATIVIWIELSLTTAPLLAVQDAEHAALMGPEVPDGAALRTLLYVEDNAANLELVEQLIARRPDWRRLSAADAILGIEFARVYQPEVILMDINLAAMSGIEAMKILARRSGDHAYSPCRAQRQCGAPRHRAGPGGRVLQLSHQAHQGQPVHGCAGCGPAIFPGCADAGGGSASMEQASKEQA